jgi:3-hydroxyacyl-[acyl-carrier-protein] dehydratase
MPPKLLFDLAGINLDHVLFNHDEIREYNAQRGDMEHLDAIVWVRQEQDQILGYKEVRTDEFWVPGHIPGKPLLPGVIMIEAAGQLASYYMRKYIGWKGFVGFGGVEAIKFRQIVVPRLGFISWRRRRGFGHGRWAPKCRVWSTAIWCSRGTSSA